MKKYINKETHEIVEAVKYDRYTDFMAPADWNHYEAPVWRWMMINGFWFDIRKDDATGDVWLVVSRNGGPACRVELGQVIVAWPDPNKGFGVLTSGTFFSTYDVLDGETPYEKLKGINTTLDNILTDIKSESKPDQTHLSDATTEQLYIELIARTRGIRTAEGIVLSQLLKDLTPDERNFKMSDI